MIKCVFFLGYTTSWVIDNVQLIKYDRFFATGSDAVQGGCRSECRITCSSPLAIRGGGLANNWRRLWAWGPIYYPTLPRGFQGFRVWGKFVFRTLELADTPTNLANQVRVGHAVDQSRSESCGPERAHQINEPSRRSSRTNRRLLRQFWGD